MENLQIKEQMEILRLVHEEIIFDFIINHFCAHKMTLLEDVVLEVEKFFYDPKQTFNLRKLIPPLGQENSSLNCGSCVGYSLSKESSFCRAYAPLVGELGYTLEEAREKFYGLQSRLKRATQVINKSLGVLARDGSGILYSAIQNLIEKKKLNN